MPRSETRKEFWKDCWGRKNLEISSLPTFARSAFYFANIYQHLGQVGQGFRCTRVHSSFLLPTLWEMLCRKMKHRKSSVKAHFWEVGGHSSVEWTNRSNMSEQTHLHWHQIYIKADIYNISFTIYLSRHIYTGTKLKQNDNNTCYSKGIWGEDKAWKKLGHSSITFQYSSIPASIPIYKKIEDKNYLRTRQKRGKS